METIGCHMVMNDNQFLIKFLDNFMFFLHIYFHIDEKNG